jgi:hypothetical protein
LKTTKDFIAILDAKKIKLQRSHCSNTQRW